MEKSDGSYVNPSLSDELRRWTVVTVRTAEGVDPDLEPIVQEAAEVELEATHRFAPIAIPSRTKASLRKNSYYGHTGPPPSQLVAISRDLRADAVAIVSVRRFDPYPPAQLCISLEIHATDTGALLFAGSALIDSGDKDTSSKIRSYREETGTDVHETDAAPAPIVSRERLARFACREALGSCPR
jgi:hypothetical protein